MENEVNDILSKLLGSKFIDATILYKFLKKNVCDIDELLAIVNVLLKESKIDGSQAFTLVEYISSFKIDINIQSKEIEVTDDWWRNPWVTSPYIYVKSPDDKNIWNGRGIAPTITYSTNTTYKS